MVGFGGGSLACLHTVSTDHQHWEGNWSQWGTASLEIQPSRAKLEEHPSFLNLGKKFLTNIFVWIHTLHLKRGFYLLSPWKCCFSLFPPDNILT